MSRSHRIVINTAASYARLAVAAASGFFTLPIVLRTLGATDYGIFAVIGGSLSFLLFINGALTSGAQRHIAYSLGEGKLDEAAQWFNASLIVHVLLALSMLLVALLSSHWVIYRLLHLPPDRLNAAMWIYRAVIAVLLCSVVSTPYQALLMAKESITAWSLMAMASSLFLVMGVFLLRRLPGDSLMWYSGIYTGSQAVLLAGPMLFCLARYSECRQLSFRRLRWKRIGELLSFSGCNLLGTLAVQIRYQGPAILLNRFVGTTANAANGIAMQVNGFAASLSTGLLRATSPSIVKSEAAGDRAEMLLLSNLSNKYAFVLLWLMVGPLLFELRYCLGVWLHQVPPDTEIFSIALLVALLVDMLTAGFMATVQAEGRIALYQGVIGVLICVSVPVGYLFLRSHMPASTVLWAGVGASALAGAGRLWFVCKTIGLKKSEWLHGVLRPCAVMTLLGCAAMSAMVFSVRPGFVRLFELYFVNSVTAIALVWVFASSDIERRVFHGYVSRFWPQMSLRSRSGLVVALSTPGPYPANTPDGVSMPLESPAHGVYLSRPSMRPEKVSILMLTHNAPRYVEISIRSLAKHTNNVNYELVVVDNASQQPTKSLLLELQREGLIHRLKLLDYNSLFAGGNNIAAREAASDSSHLLLLNSDVEIKDPNWLSHMLAIHKPGITAYGVVENPLRVDGYCLLVEAALYREHWLDENHQFFWAVTKFQGALLAQGHSVQGYAEHKKYLHHFGGKSGKDYKSAKGLVVTTKQLEGYFQGNTIQVLDVLPDGSLPDRPRRSVIDRGLSRMQRLLSRAFA